MTPSSGENCLESVDLNQYIDGILSDEDRPLFVDAVKSAEVGALRASYVMIWLACAESLKRRFKEAARRDNSAGIIVREITRKEQAHHSIDKYLLDKAKEYGFISDAAHTDLSHVYDMRCLFAHPYEQAPTNEKLIDAASTVVGELLSKPVRLRRGFCSQLLGSLLNERNWSTTFILTDLRQLL